MANLLRIPTRLYEGDSSMVVVRLAGWSDFAPYREARPLFLLDEYGDKQPLGMEIEQGFHPKCLGVELLAAGFAVEGERQQIQKVLAAPIIYEWNISPPKSGNFEIGLVFRVVDASGRTRKLGMTTHVVTVVKIDHLTSRQLWFLAAVSGALTGMLGILATLSQLGVVSFK